MAESAAHLSDGVFPPATIIRQWVLSIPIPLRYMCARNTKLQGKILRLTNALIARTIKASLPAAIAKHKVSKQFQTGAVTLIQRFGGHINLNIHFHMLHVQGAWEISKDKSSATFHAASNPSHEQLLDCVKTIAAGTIKILKKLNLVEESDVGLDLLAQDNDSANNTADDSAMAAIQAASTQNKVALGPRKWQSIRKLTAQLEEQFHNTEPQISGPMAVNFMGFSLHAGVSVWSNNKARLEQLIRYTARPAVCEERLSKAANGDIHYKLKKPWSDGTTHVVFTPLELVEKLAALVPPPRVHLTRFHGILAPNTKGRHLVVPQRQPVEEAVDLPGEKTLPLDNTTQNRIPWAKLLSRVFAIDMDICEQCAGVMKPISAILKQSVIEKILTHLGMPARAPPLAPSQIPRQQSLWEREQQLTQESPRQESSSEYSQVPLNSPFDEYSQIIN